MEIDDLIEQAGDELKALMGRRNDIETEHNLLQGRVRALTKMEAPRKDVDEAVREMRALEKEYRDKTKEAQMVQGELEEYRRRKVAEGDDGPGEEE